MTTKTSNSTPFVTAIVLALVVAAGVGFLKSNKDKPEDLNFVRLSVTFLSESPENNYSVMYRINFKQYYLEDLYESWEQELVVKPTDVINLEAVQQTSNFLQCAIYAKGQLVDFVLRHNPGKCKVTYIAAP